MKTPTSSLYNDEWRELNRYEIHEDIQSNASLRYAVRNADHLIHFAKLGTRAGIDSRAIVQLILVDLIGNIFRRRTVSLRRRASQPPSVPTNTYSGSVDRSYR